MDEFARALKRIEVPVTVIMTVRKMRTVLPSLKEPVPIGVRGGVIYHITCRKCNLTYVGYTIRHLRRRLGEHRNNEGPMKTHLAKCRTTIDEDDVKVLAASTRGEPYLKILEALWQRRLKPKLNTKKEYRGHKLLLFV